MAVGPRDGRTGGGGASGAAAVRMAGASAISVGESTHQMASGKDLRGDADVHGRGLVRPCHLERARVAARLVKGGPDRAEAVGRGRREQLGERAFEHVVPPQPQQATGGEARLGDGQLSSTTSSATEAPETPGLTATWPLISRRLVSHAPGPRG